MPGSNLTFTKIRGSLPFVILRARFLRRRACPEVLRSDLCIRLGCQVSPGGNYFELKLFFLLWHFHLLSIRSLWRGHVFTRAENVKPSEVRA